MKRGIYNLLNVKVDMLAKTLNGGKGSGNFGHYGRPHARGGSQANPDVTAHIANTAKVSIAKAQKEEPAVTANLVSSVKNIGRLAGLEYRLKSNASLARKIASDLEDEHLDATNENIQSIASKIHDNLRYTVVLPDAGFKESYEQIVSSLEHQGYKMVKVKNTMTVGESTYKGLNTLIKNPKGYIFELQFHTNATLDAKEQAHPYYEVCRDKKVSLLDRMRAGKKLKEIYAPVAVPVSAKEIKSFDNRS